MEAEIESYDLIVQQIISKYTLNTKQKKAFTFITENPIKRHQNSSEIPIAQKILYLGGHGGTYRFLL